MPFSAGVRGRAPRSVMAAPAPRSRSIRARLVTVLFQRHSASFVAPWLPARCRTLARRIYRKNCAARGKTVAASGAGHPREMMRNCVSLGRLVVLPQRKLHPSIFNLQASASRLVSHPSCVQRGCGSDLEIRLRCGTLPSGVSAALFSILLLTAIETRYFEVEAQENEGMVQGVRGAATGSGEAMRPRR